MKCSCFIDVCFCYNNCLIQGNVGLIFTKGDLKEVSEEVAKYQVCFCSPMIFFSFAVGFKFENDIFRFK